MRSPRWWPPGRRSGPRPSRTRSPCTSTWPTWPKSISGSARCASGTRAASRYGNHWPRRCRPSGPSTGPGASPGCWPACACMRSSRLTPPRPAAARSPRRCGALLARLDDGRLGASERAETRRRLKEEIDLLWRTSALRTVAMRPLDEVRAAMTAFDETLFRVVPALYRSLDRALSGPASGRAAAAAVAFLRFGSWIGADRDGNPFVTPEVTKQTVVIQAEHVLRALENATARVGRALTVHADGAWIAGPELERAIERAAQAHPDLLAEIRARSPQEPFRAYLLYAAQRL